MKDVGLNNAKSGAECQNELFTGIKCFGIHYSWTGGQN